MRTSTLRVRLATALVLSGLAFATTAAAQVSGGHSEAPGFVETINAFSYSGNPLNRVERGFGDGIDSSGLAYKYLLVTEASPTSTACTLADGTSGLSEDLIRADLFLVSSAVRGSERPWLMELSSGPALGYACANGNEEGGKLELTQIM